MRSRIHDILHSHHPEGLDCTLYGQPVRAHFGDNRCEWKAVLIASSIRTSGPISRARSTSPARSCWTSAQMSAFTALSAPAPHARTRGSSLSEPHPETYRRLALDLPLNAFKGFAAVNVALGAVEGTLNLSQDDLSLSSLANAGNGPAVRVRPLLACLAELGIGHVDVMKIDVEGYEPQVLQPFLSAAPDALVPSLVIIEALALPGWTYELHRRTRQEGAGSRRASRQ